MVNPQPKGVLLAKVQEGMAVYDRTGKNIGAVERVHLGDVEARPEERREELYGPESNEAGRVEGETGLGEVLQDVFDPADEIEEAVQDELLRKGFIQVGGPGLRGPERYFSPDQIDAVTGQGVRLDVSLGSSTAS